MKLAEVLPIIVPSGLTAAGTGSDRKPYSEVLLRPSLIAFITGEQIRIMTVRRLRHLLAAIRAKILLPDHHHAIIPASDTIPAFTVHREPAPRLLPAGLTSHDSLSIQFSHHRTLYIWESQYNV